MLSYIKIILSVILFGLFLILFLTPETVFIGIALSIIFLVIFSIKIMKKIAAKKRNENAADRIDKTKIDHTDINEEKKKKKKKEKNKVKKEKKVKKVKKVNNKKKEKKRKSKKTDISANYCKKCGKEVEKNNIYCFKCGHKID